MAQNFREELGALRGMFPSWDVDVLEELLEAHQGDVESTVDSLLAMDAAGEQPTPPPAPVQAPRSPTRRQRSPRASPLSSPRGQPRRRVQLPDDFLRLPVDEFRCLSEQEERDAILARMLQDQFFRDEVLSSEEFSSHFQGDRPTRHSRAYPPEKTAAEVASETYSAMSEKFTSMSEGGRVTTMQVGGAGGLIDVVLLVVMKGKMHEMYMRFQMRNDAPASRDPKSQRPLMDDSSDSSEDEDLNDNPDVRRRNMDQRHSQGSPKRWSPRNVTRRSNSGAGAHSKKDD
uniref:CUE domain-containing protein n=1 Tax=Phytophthora ramorum TaxID=164328 RepID=H3H3B7_PHYRM